MRNNGLILCLGLCLISRFLSAQPLVRRDGDRLIVGNGTMVLVYALRQDVPFLERIAPAADPAGGIAVRDAGFSLELDDSPVKAIGPADCSAGKFTTQNDRARVVLKHPPTGIEIRIEWQAAPQKGYVRRSLAVRCTRTPAPLLRTMHIDRLSAGLDCTLGGRGQPVFIGNEAFLGLEYPAAANRASGREIDLHHFPGKRLTKDWLVLKPEVIGTRGDRKTIEDAFAAYLADVRIPPHPFVLYNSWYDFRRKTMNTKALIATFQAFQRHLVEPWGVPLDSFVIDDQWQDKQSIWKTDKGVFPEDFGPLAAYLQKHGSHLGLWMPLTPIRHNLDLDWGKKHGYEIDDTGGHYCVSAPKFHAAMREVIRRQIERFGVNYYKHDFNNFRCRAPGHGHLPTPEHGFEANVDGYIDLLQYARSLEPGIFLNITGGMWLSPWWLMYADTVWRGGGDTGHEGVVPYIESRDDTMTYVDGVLWDRFVRERLQFPPSALMTHGIIYARLCRLGGAREPLHCWADHVIMYHAPGLMMKELYLTPDLLSEAQWAVLGPALAWAQAEWKLLANCRMTHGNPHRGEVYGYVHVRDDRLLWFLRNPSLKRQTAELDLAGKLGGPATSWSIVYPYRQDHGPAAKTTLRLAPCQTLVLEARRGDRASPLTLSGSCRYAIRAIDGAEVRLDIFGEKDGGAEAVLDAGGGIAGASLDGTPLAIRGTRAILPLRFAETPRVVAKDLSADRSGHENRVAVNVPANVEEARLALFCRSRSKQFALGPFHLDGKTTKPRLVRGAGWRIFLLSLPPGKHEITWSVPVTKRARQPFAPSSFRLAIWLFGRRALAGHALVLRLKKPIGAWSRPPTPFAGIEPFRLVIREEREISLRSGATTPLGPADLAGIKAARLHLLVADVNGAQYAHKPVLLNGVEIGDLPASSRRNFSDWQEKIMTIPKSALGKIRLTGNEVLFTNPVGDCYKVSDIGLAVQLADGTWTETNRVNDVFCTHKPGSWKYAEGTPFVKDRSPVVRLDFPTR